MENSVADLIIEIRGMGVALKLPETRMKILDLFLIKASPETLELIRGDLAVQLILQSSAE